MRNYNKIIAVMLCLAALASLSACAEKPETEKIKQTYTAAPAQTGEVSKIESYAQATDEPAQTPAATLQKNYSEEEIIQAITDLVKTQETAVKSADDRLMGETINPADKFLKTEAMHLVADQKIVPVSGYERTITDITKRGGFYVGTLTQSFTFEGDKRGSRELRSFKFEKGRAYDMGTVLEKVKRGSVTAMYPEGEKDFASGLCDTANEYISELGTMWGTSYKEPVSIKIYEEKSVFLYSVKLSMPDWAGGWYELGESIKTYRYDASLSRYEYLVRHEATHMLLAHVTGDNAPYWMQEGFATTMPDYATYGKLAINRYETVQTAFENNRLPTVKEHVSTNLETLTDTFEVRLYYSFSSAMALYLLENTEDEQVIKLFAELKKYPYIPVTMSEKVPETQAVAEECFKKVLGKSFYDFYSGFDDWLENMLSQ